MRPTPLSGLLPCVVIAAMAIAASPTRGERTFPYEAYVTADDVYVRCGPGRNYYPTDKTKAGQMVEVYRHDPGGWCAIRPPKGSFTWVSTRYLRPAGRGLAEVTSPRVAARVGSRFSDIRDVYQVRLHLDETVELVDRQLREDRPWTRIAPPSGEFRWIHGKYLDPEYPVEGVRNNRPPSDPANPPDSAEPRPERPVTAASYDRTDRKHPPAHRDRPDERRPRSTERRQSPPAEDFQQKVDALNLELSIMVAEEPTVWHFDELALDAERLITQAETAVDRGRARLLLSKIERFENIKHRHDTVEHVVANVERRGRHLAAISRRDESPRREYTAGRFDGEGRLTRVRSAREGTPRYALVDESGRITCYVTPSPGLSLRHYEQRKVGITGTRGYMPEQRAEHIMARHIDVLGEGRMR